MLDTEEGAEGGLGTGSEAVVSDEGNEEIFPAFEARAEELGEEGVDGAELAGAGELEEDGVVGVVGVAEARVEIAGVVEDLEGQVQVVLAGDDLDEALRGQVLRPRLDWRGHSV